MIKFKKLLSEVHNVETLTPRDVYNFYYMWHTSLHDPQAIETPYGKEVVSHFLGQLKAKYVRLFTRILAEQIKKYVSRGRVDADFPKGMNLDQASASELQTLMAKTFRSDMKRRNDLWNLVADYLVKLQYASSMKDTFLYINQLNNAVHHTQGRVLDKLPNYWENLRAAFDTVAQAKSVKAFAPMVDKDIRGLTNQAMMEEKEFDFFGTADKRIGPETPKGFSPKPVFGKKKDDTEDDEPSDADKKLSVMPLEAEEPDFYGTADKRIGPDTQPGKATGAPVFKKPENDDDDDEANKKLDISPLEENNIVKIARADRENIAFMSGLKIAVQDKAQDVKRDLSGYSEDFKRGYNTVKRTGWWEKANDRLTNWFSALGRSYSGRR